MGYRFGKHLAMTVPLMMHYCDKAKDGDDELREYCLQVGAAEHTELWTKLKLWQRLVKVWAMFVFLMTNLTLLSDILTKAGFGMAHRQSQLLSAGLACCRRLLHARCCLALLSNYGGVDVLQGIFKVLDLIN